MFWNNSQVAFQSFSLCLVACLLFTFALISPVSADNNDLVVQDIRLGVHPDKTRLVLDVDREVAIKAFKMTNPNRIVLTLPKSQWNVPFKSGERRLGAVSSIRYSNTLGGEGRLSLELGYSVTIDQTLVLPSKDGDGKRIVIDLKRINSEVFIDEARRDEGERLLADAGYTSGGVVQPIPKPDINGRAAQDKSVIAGFVPSTKPGARLSKNHGVRPHNNSNTSKSNGKFVIVLDPGHGGRDPGASSKSGVIEAAVVLAVAKEIKAELDKLNRYQTVLTRSGDTSIKLTDRVKFARSNNADLFISIHADSLEGQPKIRGSSVYTLDDKASDKQAALLAKKENRADILLGVDLSDHSKQVNDILINLALRESKNASIRFSRILMPEIGKVAPLMRTNQRSASFVVLKAPDVPSVLLELGYLTNESDVANLQSAKWRKRIAKAIVYSIESYFGYEVAELKG